MSTPMTDEATRTTDWITGEPVVPADFARTLERESARRAEALRFLIHAITDLARTPEYSNTELAGDLAGIISKTKNILAENKEDKT